MHEHEDPPQSDFGQRRLWTPWRMQYVGGGTKETGCIFCNRIADSDDVSSLILHRSANAIIIMNLFPYNTGHVMIVPIVHIDTPESCDPAALSDMGNLLAPTLRALRRVLSCHGFNVGMNVGSIAGAGVAEHIHEHVVPRWNGDANFMPIIGSAMIIPELIPVSYAKIRAELQRELNPGTSHRMSVVLLDPSREHVWIGPDGKLPTASIAPQLPCWKTAVLLCAELGVEAVPAGWAGPASTGGHEEIALTLVATSPSPGAWQPVTDVSGSAAEMVTRALRQLAPEVRPS